MIWLKETDSTNEEIKRRAREGASEGVWVVADQQTMGRGRRGRSWESADEGNLYMSLLLRPVFDKESASMVTLVMALSVAKVITEMTGLEAKIKWPNDIVIRGRKAVGILTELILNEEGGYYLVCGVGINVNQRIFPADIAKTATSLLTECEQQGVEVHNCVAEVADGYTEVGKIDQRWLAELLAEQFKNDYATFCKTADMSLLKDSYESFLANKGIKVRVLEPKGEYEGVALGINKDGELLVKKTDGFVEAVYAGEVSVRGIYGYV